MVKNCNINKLSFVLIGIAWVFSTIGCSVATPIAAGNSTGKPTAARSSSADSSGENRGQTNSNTPVKKSSNATVENQVENRNDARPTAPANAEIDWRGEYSYGESGGETAGGSNIVRDYALTIEKTGDKLTGRLEANGFQLYQDMICEVEASDENLKLIFNRVGDNNFPAVEFKKGDVLLTLKRSIVNGKPVTLTFWGKFKPLVNPKAADGKVYFKKLSAKRK